MGKKIKKIGSIFTMILLINMFTACSNKKNTIKTIKIGISVYDQYDTYISYLSKNLEDFLRKKEEKEGIIINITKASAASDQLVQNSQVEDFIANGCDIICVNLVDRTDPTVIINKAQAKGIPVIFFNRELVPEDLDRWDQLYYVGGDAVESGKLQAQIIIDLFQDNPSKIDTNRDGILQYAMLEGEKDHQDAIIRTEYAINTIIEDGIPVERLEDEIANWSRSQAETKMTQWIAKHGSAIEVVFTNNDDMALGAIDALEKASVENWPVIVGIDGTQDALKAIINEKMFGTVLNDERGQAFAISELACHFILDTGIDESVKMDKNRYIRLPHKIITKENVTEFLKK